MTEDCQPDTPQCTLLSESTFVMNFKNPGQSKQCDTPANMGASPAPWIATTVDGTLAAASFSSAKSSSDAISLQVLTLAIRYSKMRMMSTFSTRKVSVMNSFLRVAIASRNLMKIPWCSMTVDGVVK